MPRLTFPPGFEGAAAGGTPGSVDLYVGGGSAGALGNTNDDAHETLSTGAMNLTATSAIANANNDIGLRFLFGATAPYIGATVTEAWVTFRAGASIAAGQTLRFYAQNTDSTASFTATNFDLTNATNRPRTSPAADWSTPPFTAEVDNQTPSLITPVQQVISRAGWDRASIVIFMTRPAGTVNCSCRTIDLGTAAGVARLHIAWT